MNNKTRVLICLLIFAFIPLGFILINNQSYVANAPEASSSRYINGTAKIELNSSNFYNSSTFNTSTTYKTDAGASISLEGAGVTIHLHGTCDTAHPKSNQLWIALSGNSTSQTSYKYIDWLNILNTKYQYCYKKSSSHYIGYPSYTRFDDSASTFDSCTDSGFTRASYNTGTDKNTNASFTYTVGPRSYIITIRYYKNGSQINTRSYNKRYRTTFDITYDDVTGYHVAGVYKNSSGSTKLFNANEKLICSGTNTYYAIYQPNTYTIVYHGNENTGGSTASSSHTYDTAKALTSNGFTKTGYRFIGWSTSPKGDVVYSDGQNVKNLTATGTVNLYAQWAPITYSVAFDANGGDGGSMSPQSFTYDASQNLTKNSFTRTGHTFAGWNTEKNGTGTSYSDSASVSNLTTTNNATVTLYAQWQVNNLKANLNYMGGIVESSSLSQKYNKDGTYLSLPSPTRTGYTFKGWNTASDGSGSYYKSSTNFNDLSQVEAGHCVATPNAGSIEFTLYAIWEANEYSVNVNIYNPNGVEEYTSNINGTFTLKDDEGNVITGLYNEPSDNYITFDKSWQIYDIVAGTGRKLKASSPVTCGSGLTMSESNGVYTFTCTGISDHTINIYMEYISYTIAFNGNDNTGGSTSSKKATYDSYVTLTANGFIRAGYVFTGWNTMSDGSGKSYSDKETVKNLTSVDGATVTLYAQWKETIASGITEVYEDAGTYYINTADDLAKLIYTTESKAVGNGFTFIQTANIDLSNLTYLPIGRLNSFSATYDGQGYTISGLSSYNGTDANDNYLETNGGLFANAGGAKIKNVIIENATIYGQNAGIIAGIGNEGTKISNCVVSGTVNGTNAGSIIGNGNGASITACLAKGVNTASFAGGSANVDSCIYELTDGTRGVSDSFNDYSAWVYPSNFAYPMPKAFMWYPYPELSEDSLNTWLGK